MAVHLPVDPPAPTPVSTTPAEAEDDGVAYDYDPTGDAALDVALGFIGNLGIGPDHPAIIATSDGDFSLLKAHLATMGDSARGWEQMVALGEESFKRHTETTQRRDTEAQNAAIAVAGSAENWNEIRSWAAQNATPDEKSAMNAMFAAGGLQARAAAMLLRDAYSAAPGTTLKPASAAGKNTSTHQSQPQARLTQREFAAEVGKLVGRIGPDNIHNTPEYRALAARLAR